MFDTSCFRCCWCLGRSQTAAVVAIALDRLVALNWRSSGGGLAKSGRFTYQQHAFIDISLETAREGQEENGAGVVAEVGWTGTNSTVEWRHVIARKLRLQLGRSSLERHERVIAAGSDPFNLKAEVEFGS